MNDQELEKTLSELSNPGDPDEAMERGGGLSRAKERKRQRLFAWGIPLLSIILALSVAVPLTWQAATKKTTSNDLTGDGATGDPIAYMKLYATHYYPYAIASFVKNGVLYGDLFYSFNDQWNEMLTIHLAFGQSKGVEAYATPNDFLCATQNQDNIDFPFTGTSISFYCIFTDRQGTKITMDTTTVDVKPYYDWVMNEK